MPDVSRLRLFEESGIGLLFFLKVLSVCVCEN